MPDLLCCFHRMNFSLQNTLLSLGLLTECEVLVMYLGKMYELISLVCTVGACCSPGIGS